MSTVENQAVEPLGAAQRLIAIFLSPSSLFRDIKRNANWLPAFLMLTAISLLFCYAVQKQIGWANAYQIILQQSPKQQAQFAQMDAAQMQQAKAVGARFTSLFSWISPISILVVTSVASALLLGTLNFGFGGKARFGELFAVYMYASMPEFLHTLLAVIVIFAGLDRNSFLITNPVGSNPGYYLSPDVPEWLMAGAASFDLFTLWTVALLVIGCATVARLSRTSAAVAVCGWWLIVICFKIGIAVLQS